MKSPGYTAQGLHGVGLSYMIWMVSTTHRRSLVFRTHDVWCKEKIFKWQRNSRKTQHICIFDWKALSLKDWAQEPESEETVSVGNVRYRQILIVCESGNWLYASKNRVFSMKCKEVTHKWIAGARQRCRAEYQSPVSVTTVEEWKFNREDRDTSRLP